MFLPFLQMPTGHHQVADALIRSLQQRVQGVYFKKIDFLSYVNQRLEKMVTRTYLKWIDRSPQTYDWVYRSFVYPSSSTKHLQWYESLFQKKMQEMLYLEDPDLIVCTQAYPSFLVSRLKDQGKITTPVINVYTDFFINNVWGRTGIDYHFVPDVPLKQQLMQTQMIPEDRIFITGIPVDECFIPSEKQRKISPPYHVLISGGNAGLGDILDLLQEIKHSSEFRYSILCGNNKKLFREIASWDINNIQPLSYISSRMDMNDLYDQVDAIITKPGGVTVSEALMKRVPILIHTTLPGQEEINCKYLTSQGLAYMLSPDPPIREQLLGVLNDESKQSRWRKQVEVYCQRLETRAWKKILELTEKTGTASSDSLLLGKGI